MQAQAGRYEHEQIRVRSGDNANKQAQEWTNEKCKHIRTCANAGVYKRVRMRRVRTCMSAGTYKRVQTQALTNKHKRRHARTSGTSGESENEWGRARTSNNERERVLTSTSKRGQAWTKTNEDKRGGHGCRQIQALRMSTNADVYERAQTRAPTNGRKRVQTQAHTNEYERRGKQVRQHPVSNPISGRVF